MAKEGAILTGFMGMGKSTVGPAVAETLGVGYFDTDSWLETESGIDVPALVKSDMAAFRELEAEALRTLAEQEAGIISTGGGIVSTEVGRAALVSSDLPVVWLKAPFEFAVSRVASDTGRERPLFADIDTARGLFDERQAWYQETATHVVDAAPSPELVATDVVSVLQS